MYAHLVSPVSMLETTTFYSLSYPSVQYYEGVSSVGKKSWVFLNQKIVFLFKLGYFYLNQILQKFHESSISNKLQIAFFLDNINIACNDIAYCIMMTDYFLLIFCTSAIA